MSSRSLEDKIVHTLIAGELFKFYISELKSNGIVTQKSKMIANQFLQEFKKSEKVVDAMFDVAEPNAMLVSDVIEKYVNTIAVNIWDMENIRLIIEAYNKDTKSINGVVKKILK
jgi:hypothetical protein